MKDFSEKDILLAQRVWKAVENDQKLRTLFWMDSKFVLILLNNEAKKYANKPQWLCAALNCENPEERAAVAIAEYLSELSLEEA
jgi:hypothetical protein